MKPPQPPYKNRILAALPKAEIERLARHLSPVTLPQQKTLLDGKATHGYFLEQGIASVVVTVANGDTVEVGVIGIDGIVGLPILLGTEGSPGRTFIQIEDSGFRIDAGTLRREFERTSELRLTDINGTVLGNWIVLEVQDFDTPDFNFLSKCISEDSLSRMLSMQPGVLGFGLPVDGDVGIGVFPEGEEVFVRCKRPDAGGISVRSLRGSRLQGIGASHSQTCQRSCPAVPDNAAVVDNLLELGGSLLALSGCQVCLSTNVGGIEAGDIGDERN